MIGCESFGDRGLIRIAGTTPNGNAVITREVDGEVPYLLRGGARVITSGGFTIDDTEAPFGVPVKYRVAISSIGSGDRLVQQNLMLTPTFLHGAQGWQPGTNRTMTTEADAAAWTPAAVGKFTGNGSGGTTAVAPTLIGHVDTPVFQNTSYTLTPPTTGGTAIATNDWVVIVHQQLAAIAAPSVPVGFTFVSDSTSGTIRQLIFRRKRVGGDTGYTVTGTTGMQAIGTCLWVRGAIDEVLAAADSVLVPGGGISQLATQTITALRPRLSLAFASAATVTAAAAPTGANVLGEAAWQYTRNTGTNARTMVVAAYSNIQAGQTLPVTVTYPVEMAAGVASSVVFQGAGDLTSRVIARGKASAIASTTAEQPHLLTGRFRFLTTGLRLWSTVKAVGTWQQVKTAYPTWLDVRGVASTVPGDFLKLFVTIVNPADGTNYIPPVQVMDAGEAQVNKWIDFSVLFSNPTEIPSTAEIRLLHGTRATEYPVEWYFDAFGITPGAQRATRNTVYWFDGDSTVPAQPEDNMLGANWDSSAGDASMTWAGAAGNSVSVYTGPSAAETTTTCGLIPELSDQFMPCAPVLLSDPVNVSMAQWVGLIAVDSITYAARQSVNQVISRGPAVVISQVRAWGTGQITVMTNTLAQRKQLLTVLSSGRPLLLRIPEEGYPENGWYISIGDVEESRPVPMAKVPLREWTIPFVRVERPTALIEAASGVTWQQVKDQGTWATVRANHSDWLDVILSTEDA